MRTYSIDEFPRADVRPLEAEYDFEPEFLDDLDDLGLPDRLREIVMEGRTDSPPRPKDTSRSGWALYAAVELGKLGVPAPVIAGLQLDPRFGISESALARNDPDREAVRTTAHALAILDQRRAQQDEAVEALAAEPLEVEAKGEQPKLREDEWLDVATVDPADIPPTPWLVLGLLLYRAITLLAGKGGSGKSLLAWQIAIAVAAGSAFACWPAPDRVRRVLILSGEDDVDEIRRRVAVACQAMGVERSQLEGMLRVWSTPQITLVKREGETTALTGLWRLAKEAIRAWDVGLLVIDPAIKASSGLDEQSNSDMELAQNRIRDLTRGSDCAVLLLDHARKGDGGRDATRGASSKVDDARIAAELRPLTDAEYRALRTMRPQESLVLFQTVKQNYGAPSGKQVFEFVDYEVGNGEQRPALVHRSASQLSEPIWDANECPFRDELLAMVRDGREDGRPWCVSPQAKKETRLSVAVAERFDLSEKDAAEWLQVFERDGLIERFDWTSPSRKVVTCWKLVETEPGSPG